MRLCDQYVSIYGGRLKDWKRGVAIESVQGKVHKDRVGHTMDLYSLVGVPLKSRNI